MIHYDEHMGLLDLPVIVENAVRDLKPHLGEFDSIACQGVSGVMVASPLSIALARPLVVVRKDDDMPVMRCIHKSMVEGAPNAGRRILFVDDYVGEGKTLFDVMSKIIKHTSGTVTCRYETLYREFLDSTRVWTRRV